MCFYVHMHRLSGKIPRKRQHEIGFEKIFGLGDQGEGELMPESCDSIPYLKINKEQKYIHSIFKEKML